MDKIFQRNRGYCHVTNWGRNLVWTIMAIFRGDFRLIKLLKIVPKSVLYLWIILSYRIWSSQQVINSCVCRPMFLSTGLPGQCIRDVSLLVISGDIIHHLTFARYGGIFSFLKRVLAVHQFSQVYLITYPKYLAPPYWMRFWSCLN